MESENPVSELYRFLNDNEDPGDEVDPEEKLSLTLCRAKEHELSDEMMERWERLENKVSSLEYNGRIDDAEFQTFWDKSIPERRYRDDPRINQWKRWGRRRGFEPPLNEIEINGNTWLVLPDTFLLIKVGGDLKGFFPCSDGKTDHPIERVLNRLKEGKDWEKWEENESTLSSRDPSPIHGAIKAHTKGNSEELLGEEWVYSKDERLVGEDGWKKNPRPDTTSSKSNQIRKKWTKHSVNCSGTDTLS